MAERILSAGVVVLRPAREGWHVLLLRAYNYWDCPKGVVEAGESPLETARREVREETGLEELEFRWGEAFIETEPYSRNKVARYYVAVAKEAPVKLPVSPRLGVPEHHGFRWLEFADAKRLSVARIRRVLEWAEVLVAGAD